MCKTHLLASRSGLRCCCWSAAGWMLPHWHYWATEGCWLSSFISELYAMLLRTHRAMLCGVSMLLGFLSYASQPKLCCQAMERPSLNGCMGPEQVGQLTSENLLQLCVCFDVHNVSIYYSLEVCNSKLLIWNMALFIRRIH